MLYLKEKRKKERILTVALHRVYFWENIAGRGTF